jgi:hypothetical protein
VQINMCTLMNMYCTYPCACTVDSFQLVDMCTATNGHPTYNMQYIAVSPPRSSPSVLLLKCGHAEHSFLGRRNTRQNITQHAPLISNSSDEDSRYFAIIRRSLTSNDGLPPFKACGIASMFNCLHESSVAHRPPNLRGKTVSQFDELEMCRIRNEQN